MAWPESQNLTASGETSCCSLDEYWETGLTVQVYRAGNQSFLLRHQISTGVTQVYELNSGTVGALVNEDVWSTNAFSQMIAVSHNNHVSLVRLSESGELELLEVAADGIPMAVSDLVECGHGMDSDARVPLTGRHICILVQCVQW